MNDGYLGAPEDQRGYWDDKEMPEDESRYGLKLESYDGQPVGMWVVGDDQTRLELTADEIDDALVEYQTRNPKGDYRIERIT